MSEDDGDVDPRFDPRFQRGYDPSRHPSRGAASRSGAERSAFTRPDADDAADPIDESLYVRPMPTPVSADEEAEAPQPDAAVESEQDAEHGERGSSLLWLIGLAALSVAATVAGAVGVFSLLTGPPVRLEITAETMPAALRIALELVSGPVLAAGLVGVAVALALGFAPRKDRG